MYFMALSCADMRGRPNTTVICNDKENVAKKRQLPYVIGKEDPNIFATPVDLWFTTPR
jgi:hypothetical protein